MKRLLLGCAVAGLLSVPAAQAQDGPAVFRPTGGWTADFGDDYCRLVRTFSDGSDEVSVALERVQPGGFLRILLVGDGVSTFRGADQIGYTLLPSGSERETRYVRSETADGDQFLGFDALTLAPFVFTPGTPPAPYNRDTEQATARGINAIALGKGLTSPVRFETGSLRAPVEVMQTCADDLLGVWGLDVEKHKTMTIGVIPNPAPGGVLPQGTIPFTEFGKLGGGANQVRVIVGTDGKPTSCVIYSPSLSETLNRRICSLVMDKATFQPARDAGGQAMASYWMGSPLAFGPPFPGRGGGGGGAARAAPMADSRAGLASPPSDAPTVTFGPLPDNPDARVGTPVPSTPGA